MNCEEARIRLSGFLDGELSATAQTELEAHWTGCDACAHERDRQRASRAAFREQVPYHRAPESLRARIRSQVRAGDPGPRAAGLAGRQWLALAASIAILVMGGAEIASRRSGRAADALAAEVVASHVRSLMASHLTDIGSTDQHTVKPWFDGKLDFAPPVLDLAGAGFPLVGGRLDYLAGRPVAALVYGRHRHVINLFLWPAAGSARDGFATRQGYSALYGATAGMTYWAVSDLNLDELREFARLFAAGAGPKS